MRLSAVWNSFSQRDAERRYYANPDFQYRVSFETAAFQICVRYYQQKNGEEQEIRKDDIPQTVFSAMLQSENWEPA